MHLMIENCFLVLLLKLPDSWPDDNPLIKMSSDNQFWHFKLMKLIRHCYGRVITVCIDHESQTLFMCHPMVPERISRCQKILQNLLQKIFLWGIKSLGKETSGLWTCIWLDNLRIWRFSTVWSPATRAKFALAYERIKEIQRFL